MYTSYINETFRKMAKQVAKKPCKTFECRKLLWHPSTINGGNLQYSETLKMCTPWNQGNAFTLGVFTSQWSFHNVKNTYRTEKLCSH